MSGRDNEPMTSADECKPGAYSRALRARKALSHIEIYPKLGGGHLVRHVYHGWGKEQEFTFITFNQDGKTQGGEHIQQHVTKHAGLPANIKDE